MSLEQWKEVYYNGLATGKEISSCGRVRMVNGKIVQPISNTAGYQSVAIASVQREGKQHLCVRKYVHRLVAEYFLDGYKEELQINHKNCNKKDNTLDNLELTTPSENIIHAHLNKRMLKRGRTAINYLSSTTIEECYIRIIKGEKITEIGKLFNIPRTTLSSIINKRSHKELTDALDILLGVAKIQPQTK